MSDTQSLPDKNNSVPAKPKAPSKARKSHFKAMAFAVLFLIVLGLALYSFQINQQLKQTLLEKTSDYGHSLTAQQSQLNSLQSNFRTLRASMDDAPPKTSSLESMSLLRQAQQLLEMANISNFWTQNKEASIILLQQADSLLAEAHSAKILPVRQAIARQIAEIHSIARVDTAGILSKIDGAIGLVNQLSLNTPLPTHDDNNTAQSSGWRTHWQKTLAYLKTIIVIRHQKDETYSPPFQQNLARQLIRINLRQAQLALLQNNQQAYDLALQFTENEIENSLFSKASCQALMQQIRELKNTTVTQTAIFNDEALQLLKPLTRYNSSEKLEGKPL